MISARSRVFLPLHRVFFSDKDAESVCLKKLIHRVTPMGKQSLVQEKNRTWQMHSVLFQGCKESGEHKTCSESDRKINSYLRMEDKVQKKFGNEMSVAVLLEE